MEFREYQAKSLDEAITNASIDLGVVSSELYYEVTEKGSGGILGFGKKDVTIKACRRAEYEKAVEAEAAKVAEEEKANKVMESVEFEESDSPREEKEHHPTRVLTGEEIATVSKAAEDFLAQVFATMDLSVEAKIEYSSRDNSLSIEMFGDHMGIIIGKRGQTLDSLQYLVNLVVNKHTDTYIRVKLDTEDYRKRRKDTLENLAKNIAAKVKKTGKPVTLEAMNPYERRTIHYALQKDRYVTTYSEGEEPFRHVVVTIKK